MCEYRCMCIYVGMGVWEYGCMSMGVGVYVSMGYKHVYIEMCG